VAAALQDARDRQADRDDGADQHVDRGQSAFAGEAAFAHSGHSLAGILRIYSGMSLPGEARQPETAATTQGGSPLGAP
jgi:hypothetical protein